MALEANTVAQDLEQDVTFTVEIRIPVNAKAGSCTLQRLVEVRYLLCTYYYHCSTSNISQLNREFAGRRYFNYGSCNKRRSYTDT